MEEKEIKSVIILGSGPAGLSAALYAARAELHPLVLTGMQLGGQAALTNVIENYPGFPEGVGGAELGDLFQKQAERFGARIEFDTVETVDLRSNPKMVKTFSKELLANSVIIATGASSLKLNVPGEELLSGKGVSYCATCDGWFFKDKDVVVVGGGDSALEEALFLTRYATTVTIIHRRDQFRAGVLLQNRIRQNGKIRLVLESVVKEIQGEDKVTSILVQNVKSGEHKVIRTDGIFVFIGHKPNNEIYRDQIEMDEHGYIKVNMKMETSEKGVYACGEAADSEFRQVATSAGMGAAAAIQAAKYLEKLEK